MALPSPIDIERGCRSITDLVKAQEQNEDVQADWRLLESELQSLARGISLGIVLSTEANSLIRRVDDWTVTTFGEGHAFTLLIHPLSTMGDGLTEQQPSQYKVGDVKGNGNQIAQGTGIKQSNITYNGDRVTGGKREINTGGGTYIGGAVNTTGDFVGRDKISGSRNNTGGGTYNEGKINNSGGVNVFGGQTGAINYNDNRIMSASDQNELKKLFDILHNQINTLPSSSSQEKELKAEVEDAAKALHEEVEAVKKDPTHKPRLVTMNGLLLAFKKLGGPVLGTAVSILGFPPLGAAINLFAANINVPDAEAKK